MASPITNPSVVNFCNGTLRPFANILATLILSAPEIIAYWNAQLANLVSGNASTDIVVDGASKDGVDNVGGDGRLIITLQSINNMLAFLTAFSNYSANGTLSAGTANATTHNQIMAWNVNGQQLPIVP